MAKDTEVTIRITQGGIIRLKNSTNGNPRYQVNGVVDPGTDEARFMRYNTMSDASFTYAIRNGWIGKRYRTATLTLTPAGRVRNLKYLD